MNTLTVTQLTKYLRSYLLSDGRLKNIAVKGEISNLSDLRKYRHAYFTLKDDGAQLKCMLFAEAKNRLKFEPKNTMKVICTGSIDIYEPDGVYQLRVTDILPQGIGDLALAFEQMKEKLDKEGLFDAAHKKPLPPYPQKIGVATSPGGAVVHDIIDTLRVRYPLAEVVFVPTVVQGEEAPADIVRSVHLLDARGDIDVIIVGRGGGSLENLWAFNTEAVARAIYQCRTPIVSAVGHETDYTISDFVADYRALTPTAAAVAVSPDIAAERERLATLQRLLLVRMTHRLEREEARLVALKEKPALADKTRFIDAGLERLSLTEKQLRDSIRRIAEGKERQFVGAVRALEALSPLAVLSRGYSLVKKDGTLVKSVHQLHESDELTIILNDGSARAVVKEVTEHEG